MSESETNSKTRGGHAWGCSSDLAPGDRANYRNAQAVILLWVLVLAAVVFGLKYWKPEPGPLAYAVAAIPGLVMTVGFLLYGRFLYHADELTRKIQTEGMALGFAVGLVVALSYRVLELVGAPDLSTSDVVIVGVVAAVAGIQWQQRRYR